MILFSKGILRRLYEPKHAGHVNIKLKTLLFTDHCSTSHLPFHLNEYQPNTQLSPRRVVDGAVSKGSPSWSNPTSNERPMTRPSPHRRKPSLNQQNMGNGCSL